MSRRLTVHAARQLRAGDLLDDGVQRCAAPSNAVRHETPASRRVDEHCPTTPTDLRRRETRPGAATSSEEDGTIRGIRNGAVVLTSIHEGVRELAALWPGQRLDTASTPFQVDVRRACFSGLTVELIQGSSFSSIRDEDLIRRHPTGDLTFDVVLTGRLWREHRGAGDVQLEHDVALSPDDEPSTFHWHSAGSMVRVRRSMSTLPFGRDSIRSLPVGVLPATPLAQGYAAFATATARALSAGTLLRREFGDALSSLTSSVLEESVNGDQAAQILPLQVRVQQYIDTHYSDRRLSPPFIANELGVSLRAVHKAFNTADRTVGSYTRQRRTNEAVQRLRGGFTSSLNDLAVQCGFGGRDQLRRAISEVYGLPASRALREARLESSHRRDRSSSGE